MNFTNPIHWIEDRILTSVVERERRMTSVVKNYPPYLLLALFFAGIVLLVCEIATACWSVIMLSFLISGVHVPIAGAGLLSVLALLATPWMLLETIGGIRAAYNS